MPVAVGVSWNSAGPLFFPCFRGEIREFWAEFEDSRASFQNRPVLLPVISFSIADTKMWS
jgi:hypothetical protein